MALVCVDVLNFAAPVHRRASRDWSSLCLLLCAGREKRSIAGLREIGALACARVRDGKSVQSQRSAEWDGRHAGGGQREHDLARECAAEDRHPVERGRPRRGCAGVEWLCCGRFGFRAPMRASARADSALASGIHALRDFAALCGTPRLCVRLRNRGASRDWSSCLLPCAGREKHSIAEVRRVGRGERRRWPESVPGLNGFVVDVLDFARQCGGLGAHRFGSCFGPPRSAKLRGSVWHSAALRETPRLCVRLRGSA